MYPCIKCYQHQREITPETHTPDPPSLDTNPVPIEQTKEPFVDMFVIILSKNSYRIGRRSVMMSKGELSDIDAVS